MCWSGSEWIVNFLIQVFWKFPLMYDMCWDYEVLFFCVFWKMNLYVLFDKTPCPEVGLGKDEPWQQFDIVQGRLLYRCVRALSIYCCWCSIYCILFESWGMSLSCTVLSELIMIILITNAMCTGKLEFESKLHIMFFFQ